MKRKELIREIRTLSETDLKERARSIAEERMKLRFRKASGQVEQPHRLIALRRELARIQTVLREKKSEHAA